MGVLGDHALVAEPSDLRRVACARGWLCQHIVCIVDVVATFDEDGAPEPLDQGLRYECLVSAALDAHAQC